ncbi:MAG: hypothetical protein LBT00_13245 [Spirochaetaceae bacterium]|nr:hypothetical protein [Spirochaetaceae bacterium]
MTEGLLAMTGGAFLLWTMTLLFVWEISCGDSGGVTGGGNPPLKGVADDQTEGDVDAPLGAEISTGERAGARGKAFPPFLKS